MLLNSIRVSYSTFPYLLLNTDSRQFYGQQNKLMRNSFVHIKYLSLLLLKYEVQLRKHSSFSQGRNWTMLSGNRES